MKSATGIVCISLFQLILGLSLLAVYESYKVAYMNSSPGFELEKTISTGTGTETNLTYASLRSVYTPLDWMFYLSIFNNIFSLFFCLAGVLNSVKEVVMGFFIFNAVLMILAFHYFVDVWTDVGVKDWSNGKLGSYERMATALIFFNVFFSFCAIVYGVRALNEIKSKAREEYHRLSVISDNLQFDPDGEKP